MLVFDFAFVFVHLGGVLVNLGDEVVAHGSLVHPVLLHTKLASIPEIRMVTMFIMLTPFFMKMLMMMMMMASDELWW